MMRARTHLFGSVDGYRTMARAPGVTDAEDAALGALGFGSPRSDIELEELARVPCIAGRVLPSGRYAITRVFPGCPDIAGRGTIERRTLILELEDWNRLARLDLAAALLLDTNWTRERFVDGACIELTVGESADLLPSVGETDRRAFDGLLAAQKSGRCAALPCNSRWNEAILRLAGLLPRSHAGLLGWGIGLWAVPAGVWIATLRVEPPPRNAFRAQTTGAWLHPEQVARLGEDDALRPEDLSTRTAPRHAVRWIRHLPWIVGVAVALLASLLLLLFVLAHGAEGVPPTPPPSVDSPTVPSPPTSAPTVPMVTPPKGVTASSDTAAPRDGAGNAAESDHDPGQGTASESASQPSAPATPVQPSTAGTSASGMASPDGTSGDDAPGGFGSGSPSSDAAPTTNSQPPVAPQSTPPEAPEAPDSGPIHIPDVTIAPDTTPWSLETELLRTAIDARERIAASSDVASSKAIAADLQTLATRLAQRNRENEAPKADGRPPQALRCLIDLDPRGRNRSKGVPSEVRTQLANASSSPLVRRMLLLAARFEVSVAASELVRSGKLPHDALSGEPAIDAGMEGWPNGNPWEPWYFRDRSLRSWTASDAARYVASEFIVALQGMPGNTEAMKELRRISNRQIAPGGTAP